MNVTKVMIRFWREERALGTLEVLLIVAVLVALALVFRKYIVSWFHYLMSQADQSMSGSKTDMNQLKQLVPKK